MLYKCVVVAIVEKTVKYNVKKCELGYVREGNKTNCWVVRMDDARRPLGGIISLEMLLCGLCISIEEVQVGGQSLEVMW